MSMKSKMRCGRFSKRNLYVHFPFCRSKCSYCALYSRSGSDAGQRDRYIEILRREISGLDGVFDTVYFGGGTPAMCDLGKLGPLLLPRLAPDCEFTVELHPLDVSGETLSMLRQCGVNRISMGLQSLDDATLSDMGRGYTFAVAERAFSKIKEVFDNAGVDIIAGYPFDVWTESRFSRLGQWGLRHCSVYSLQFEPESALYRRKGAKAPDDDILMDAVRAAAEKLESFGLKRYEISNYAVEGFECRHNLAVWRGEDYIGIGAGACGREGLIRTRNRGLPEEGFMGMKAEREEVDEIFDRKERSIFSLRTIDGLEAVDDPLMLEVLKRHEADGLVRFDRGVFKLTDRGCEVCDSILADLA